MRSHQELFDLVPLYALDALDGEELTDLVAHLETCDECRAEVGRHLEVVASLVPDGHASEAVWGRIIGEIRFGDGSAPAVPLTRRSHPPGMWVTAVAAALAVVLGVVALVQRQALNQLEGPVGVVAAADRAAADPGSLVVELASEAGTVARVIVTADGEGFVIPAELDPLGADRTYQLWVITPDELVISAGVLGNDPRPARFTWSGDIAGFALTREVAGGVVSSEGDVVAVAEI